MLVHTRQNAQQWREDPVAAAEIEGRLKQHGFDAVAINAEVYVQAERQLEMFENLEQRAHQRRIVLLREISVRREFAKQVEGISKAVIDAEFLGGPKHVLRTPVQQRQL
jgi:hypothetical protein